MNVTLWPDVEGLALLARPVVVAMRSGITAFEAAEASPVPMSLVAVTVKVYVSPLVSPLDRDRAAGPGGLLAAAGRLGDVGRGHRVRRDRAVAGAACARS